MKFLDNIQKKLRLMMMVKKLDQKNIDRLFTRVFLSEDGQKVLAYLHHLTTSRITNPNATTEELRHKEGQHALVQTIQKLTDRGRHSS